MDQPDPFDQAPDLKKDFNPKTDELQPSTDATKWPTQDEVEHLDLADRAYTPGGELEYRVHKQVRLERTTQWHQPSKTPSLTDEQELDFNSDFQKAGGPSALRDKEAGLSQSPDELRSAIENRLNETSRKFDRSAGPDRGAPDR